MLEGMNFQPARIGQFARLLASLQRDEIETAIESIIARLDNEDGDPDLEPDGFALRSVLDRRARGRIVAEDAETDEDEANGDELDGNGAEDDFADYAADGPGCPIADPDHCEAGDDNPNRLYGDGAPGDPDDAEDSYDQEAVDEREESAEDYDDRPIVDLHAYRRHRDYLRRVRCVPVRRAGDLRRYRLINDRGAFPRVSL